MLCRLCLRPAATQVVEGYVTLRKLATRRVTSCRVTIRWCWRAIRPQNPGLDGKILACKEAGITVTLPKLMTSNSKAEGRLGLSGILCVRP